MSGLELDLAALPPEFRDMLNPPALHPDLSASIVKVGLMDVLRHPYVIMPFYSPIHNKWANDAYEQKRLYVKKAIEEKEWTRVLVLHERPFRLDALLAHRFDMTDREYWENIGWVWTDSENPGVNHATWEDLFTADRPGKEYMMDDKERAALKRLPERLTIYRGADRGHSRRHSWTTDQSKARWFANRYGKGVVYKTWIAKADIHAYFTGRNEREIVVRPSKLRKIEIIP